MASSKARSWASMVMTDALDTEAVNVREIPGAMRSLLAIVAEQGSETDSKRFDGDRCTAPSVLGGASGNTIICASLPPIWTKTNSSITHHSRVR
mmetsp:Transcript_42325/g.104903  ORF Transcript_42325/g.104903 Transcript_42325/m.104903 type:complete len:94 (-) Transcript_42325:1089-1370(-)